VKIAVNRSSAETYVETPTTVLGKTVETGSPAVDFAPAIQKN
jgi:hypothetical protein